MFVALNVHNESHSAGFLNLGSMDRFQGVREDQIKICTRGLYFMIIMIIIVYFKVY